MKAPWPTQYPEAEQVIVHLSDTHLTSARAPLFGQVDSDANLERALRALRAMEVRPAAIVVTGDVADKGAPDAYARVRALIEPVAAELGAPLVWVMGNHDLRPEFRSGLLDEPEGPDANVPVDAVHDLDGLRLIALDSSVPGVHWGEIGEAQLEWLREVLATPAPRGTILALHHPPVPSPQWLNQLIELKGQAALEEVVRGTDVRAILAGHLHYSTHGTFAGVPVAVASSTCYSNDVAFPETGLSTFAGAPSFDVVHVYPDRTLHTTVPFGDYPTVYEVTAEQTARMLALPEEQMQVLIQQFTTVGGMDAPPQI